jgi:drug/metabolite transporter (DMT)-like permease
MLHDFGSGSWPIPRNQAEWLALSSGIGFSLTNVITRHSTHLSIPAKSMLVWVGVAAMALILLSLMGQSMPALTVFNGTQWQLMLLIGVLLIAATIFVQYGVTKITAIRASVLFLFELVVAAIASYYLANEAMTWNEWLGGALIIAAALISAVQHKST